ncbi:MAG: hypothetical protein IT443_04285 [Phycisphaeraceae bacterium]|nr:hypothetical protein [Phycisphaeraceae bacterium]
MSDTLSDSSIAVTLTRLCLPKRYEDVVDGDFEQPYLVCMAMDQASRRNLCLYYSFLPFPKLAGGGAVRLLDQGYPLYGPSTPGDFVLLTLMVMESERNLQTLNAQLADLIGSQSAALGLPSALADSEYRPSDLLTMLKELTDFLTGTLTATSDNELFRLQISFFRDDPIPYQLNREYDLGNDYVDLTLRICPMANNITLFPRLRTINLDKKNFMPGNSTLSPS